MSFNKSVHRTVGESLDWSRRTIWGLFLLILQAAFFCLNFLHWAGDSVRTASITFPADVCFRRISFPPEGLLTKRDESILKVFVFCKKIRGARADFGCLAQSHRFFFFFAFFFFGSLALFFLFFLLSLGSCLPFFVYRSCPKLETVQKWSLISSFTSGMPFNIQLVAQSFLRHTNFVIVFQLVCRDWKKCCRAIEKG